MNFTIFVGQDLRFGRALVAKYGKDSFSVTYYGEAECAFFVLGGIVSFQINACKFISFPICLDFIMFLEDLEEVVGMFSPTYSIPKSSTIRQNWIGRQVCFHSPGVVADSE